MLLTAVLLAVAGTVSAQAYKWRDADGKLHFSDKPPANAKADKLDIKPAVPENPDAVKQAQAMQAQRESAAFAEKQAKQKAAIAAEKEQRQNDNKCLSARRSLDTLNRQRPVYRVGKDGERHYLEDDARAAEIQKKQALANQYCR